MYPRQGFWAGMTNSGEDADEEMFQDRLDCGRAGTGAGEKKERRVEQEENEENEEEESARTFLKSYLVEVFDGDEDVDEDVLEFISASGALW